MASKKSGLQASKTYVSTYGISDFVRKLDKFFDDVQTPLSKAYKAGMAKPEAIIKDWFDRPEGKPHRVTGTVIGSYVDGQLVWKGDDATYQYGYRKDKGGLPVIFFEYGTPRIPPQFVMYYAVRNAVPEIEDEILAELERLAREEGMA